MSKIALTGNASGTGTLTIAAPNTSTDRTLTLPDEAGTVLTSASSITQNSGPVFTAYRGSSQSLSAASWNKLAYDVEEFDTDGCYDSTTNYRFQPTVAGYYQLSMGASISGGYTGLVSASFRKNGTINKQLGYQNSTWYHFNGSALVYCNGTTDYVETWLYIGGSGTLVGNQPESYFTGALVRKA